MSLWVAVALFAAFMQNLRFMLQRHLKATELSTAGATFARFVYPAPFVWLAVLAYVAFGQVDFPQLVLRFWGFALVGGVAQILATACVVSLFSQRNFVVGIALKKSEVILSAFLGVVVLGEGVSPLAVGAILLGFGAVILLSDPPKGEVALPWKDRIFNAASGYGLTSGLLFGVSAVCYRGATLEIASEDPIFRALCTLAVVVVWQSLVMVPYMAWRERGQIAKVALSWRVSLPMGLTSILGSIGWFIAFTLQNVAYVKALGQVELLFSYIGAYFIFKESIRQREVIGVLLLIASILALVLVL